MNQDKGDSEKDEPVFRARLPGFVTGDEIGLGDVVTRGAATLGIRPCGGCARRAAALNRLMVFSSRTR